MIDSGRYGRKLGIKGKDLLPFGNFRRDDACEHLLDVDITKRASPLLCHSRMGLARMTRVRVVGFCKSLIFDELNGVLHIPAMAVHAGQWASVVLGLALVVGWLVLG